MGPSIRVRGTSGHRASSPFFTNRAVLGVRPSVLGRAVVLNTFDERICPGT